MYNIIFIIFFYPERWVSMSSVFLGNYVTGRQLFAKIDSNFP